MKNEITIKSVNPLSMSNWNELVLQNVNYSIFHSKEWCEVLQKTYGYKPHYFASIDEDKFKVLFPMMLVNSFLTGKRLVSLPFSDYCEPIFEDNDITAELMKSILNNQKKNVRYIELRGGTSFLKDKSIFSNGYLHKLDLSLGEDNLFANFRSSNRRNIKKAIRESIEVKFSKDFRSIIDFYNLNIITRKRHGLPPQPFNFFRNIGEILMPGGFCEVAESYYKGKVIASCVFLSFGKKVIYKFGASDYNFQNLRANDLIFGDAIKRYSELGYETFCFGRTAGENESLRHFKLGWGAAEILSPYFRYYTKSEKFESKSKFTLDSPREVGFHNYVFKHSPKSVLKLIGSVSYRHIG